MATNTTKATQSPETETDRQSLAHAPRSDQAPLKQNEPESVNTNAETFTSKRTLPSSKKKHTSSHALFEQNIRLRARVAALQDATQRDAAQWDAARQYTARRYTAHWKLHNIESELCKGDTLIFVDFPRLSADDHKNDCFGHEWSSVHFRASSHNLRATGSTKFAGMLDANYQSRIQRKRNLLNKLPQGIRFVLDLTPPFEGEELVSQIRDVALTPGIIGWWTASDKHGVDGSVVFGHDDVCTCSEDSADDGEEIPKYSSSDRERLKLTEEDLWLGMRRPDKLSLLSRTLHEVQPHVGRRFTEWKRKAKHTAQQVPTHRKIPEYCPARHRVGILRLMLIIENRPVMIDSAPLIWTLVAVANIFDCARVVRDVFREWLMSPNNTVFVEALPEESLKLGFTLLMDDVTRSAFRILVNELALEQAAADTRDIHKIAPYTVFGRKRHNPGDYLNRLIQHAAYAMFQRVSEIPRRILGRIIFEDLRIPEWELLQSLLQTLNGPPEDAAFRELEDVAQHFRRTLNRSTGYIADKALEEHLKSYLVESIDDYRATYIDTPVFRPFGQIHKGFNIVQKFMCPFVSPTIFEDLSRISTTFSLGFTNFNVDLREKLSKYPDLRREFDKGWLSAQEQFGLRGFQDSLTGFISSIQQNVLLPKVGIPMKATRQYMLLTLTQNEFRFLPPWAGGNNDGTGAVFEDSLFPAGHGPEAVHPMDSMIPSNASDLPDCEGGTSTQTGSEGRHSAVSSESVDSQEIVPSTLEPNMVTTPTDGQLLLEPKAADLNPDSPAPHCVKPPEPPEPPKPHESYVAAFGRRTREVLAMTGLIERDVPPGHQRIRWKNVSP
ncbi:hypothetical protein CDEST_14894 [Colletotrichum destructivum]|uniref:Uncharacterized protein n=1 Tax=Colletotrichum destructivum TaxID=34406 RepID=A0AAX4J376_9PEZI|nr:hypothetical protein CDEST_14894 [Colletotrichum destructivum]